MNSGTLPCWNSYLVTQSGTPLAGFKTRDGARPEIDQRGDSVMANSYLNDAAPPTEAFKIATIVSDPSRKVALLTADIECEEVRTGIRDLADPAYSELARSLGARRDNLQATISSLEPLTRSLPEAA